MTLVHKKSTTEFKGKSPPDMVHVELVLSPHLGLGAGSDPSETAKERLLFRYLLNVNVKNRN